MVKLHISFNVALLLTISFYCHGMQKKFGYQSPFAIKHKKRNHKIKQKVKSLEIRLGNITRKTHPDFTERLNAKIYLYNKILKIPGLDLSIQKIYTQKQIISELQIQEDQLHIAIKNLLQCIKTGTNSTKSLQEQYTFLHDAQASLINLYTQLLKTLNKRHKKSTNKNTQKRIRNKIKKLKTEQQKKNAQIHTMSEELVEKIQHTEQLRRKIKRHKKLKQTIPRLLSSLNTKDETIAIIASKQHAMQLLLSVDPDAYCKYNANLANLERKRCLLIVEHEITEIEKYYPTTQAQLQILLAKYKTAQTYCPPASKKMCKYKHRCNELAEECSQAMILQKIRVVSQKGKKIEHWETLCSLYEEMQKYCTYNKRLNAKFKQRQTIALVIIERQKKANRKIFLEKKIKKLETITPTVQTAHKLTTATQELQTYFERNSPYWNKYERHLELLKIQKKQLARKEQNIKEQERRDKKLFANWVTAEDTSITIAIQPPKKTRVSKLLTSSGTITKDKLVQTYEG